MSREIKVGALVILALVVLAVGIFLVGERKNLFSRKIRYFVRFETVAGLSAGNPVQLNGVNVGKVEQVVLPERVDEKLLTVWISMDRRYAPRVRADSTARIKTLGLLGDKYIEITSGSPQSPEIASDGEIPTAPATDVDKLIASGEDVVENVMAISVSLRSILADMEAGKGILGELITDSEAGRKAKDAMVESLDAIRGISEKIERGDGTLAGLINDDTFLRRLEGSLDRFEAVMAKVDEGEGALPALLNDPQTRERVTSTIASLDSAAEDFSSLAARFAEGDGLLARLLSDEEYGRRLSTELEELISNLNRLSEKLDQGEGTLGQMINDPAVYQALNDVVLGINESKLLRWLIRNRQKKGFKTRHRQEWEEVPQPAVESPNEPAAAPGR